MALPSEVCRIDQTAAGGTQFFFNFFTESPSHLEVFLNGGQITTGFQIELNEEQYVMPGGNIVFDVAPGIGDTIRVQRTLPLTQDSVWSPFGAFRAKSLEAQFDRMVMQVQQIARDLADLGAGAGGTVSSFEDMGIYVGEVSPVLVPYAEWLSTGTGFWGWISTAPGAVVQPGSVAISVPFAASVTTIFLPDTTLASAPVVPAVVSIAIAPVSAVVAPLATQQFTATINVVGGASQAVTWSVIAGEGSITSGGLFTAGSTGEVTSTVMVTSDFDNSKVAFATMDIVAGSVWLAVPLASSVAATFDATVLKESIVTVPFATPIFIAFVPTVGDALPAPTITAPANASTFEAGTVFVWGTSLAPLGSRIVLYKNGVAAGITGVYVDGNGEWGVNVTFVQGDTSIGALVMRQNYTGSSPITTHTVTVTAQAGDSIAPTVDTFSVSLASGGLVNIVAFTASDNVGVTQYLVTKTSAQPALDNPGWSASAPTTFAHGGNAGPGSLLTVYPWVRDAAGNINTVSNASTRSLAFNFPFVTAPFASAMAATFVPTVFAGTRSTVPLASSVAATFVPVVAIPRSPVLVVTLIDPSPVTSGTSITISYREFSNPSVAVPLATSVDATFMPTIASGAEFSDDFSTNTIANYDVSYSSQGSTDLTISGGVLTHSSEGNTLARIKTTTFSSTANGVVEAVCSTNSISEGCQPGVVARISGDAVNSVTAAFIWAFLRADALYLYEHTSADAWNLLGSYSFSPSSNTGYKITMRFNGTAVTVYLDGTLRITGTASVTSTGQVGVMTLKYVETSTSSVSYDDLKADHTYTVLP